MGRVSRQGKSRFSVWGISFFFREIEVDDLFATPCVYTSSCDFAA
jgi:hypothetical protein